MAAADAASRPTPAQLIEREQVERPRAVLAASISAVVGVGSMVAVTLAYRGYPRVSQLEVLQAALGADLGRPGLRSEQLQFVADRAPQLMLATGAQALASLLFAYLLVLLYRAAADRGVNVPRFTPAIAIGGGVSAALGTLGLQTAIQVNAANAVDRQDWTLIPATGPVANASFVLLLLSTMALAVATVLVALAAMRTGLLTRFLGGLGIAVGVIMVFFNPAVSGSAGNGFVIQSIWVLLVALSLSGKLPSGLPPAWEAGEARPWPSQQQVRAQRQKEAGGKSRSTNSKPGEPAEASTPGPSPATSKKKRKKRARNP